MSDIKSEKSYGIAVILCGIFGTLGIHHFYLGNILHGLLDLGLVVLFVVLIFSNLPIAALLVLLVDVVHTIAVFYLLITEQAKDSLGRYVRL